jgi:type 1 glutamine amidotransferase
MRPTHHATRGSRNADDEGKGFIGIHSATITFTKWPAYGEMICGYFDEHPWGTIAAPVIVEDPAFPGMKQCRQRLRSTTRSSRSRTSRDRRRAS